MCILFQLNVKILRFYYKRGSYCVLNAKVLNIFNKEIHSNNIDRSLDR